MSQGQCNFIHQITQQTFQKNPKVVFEVSMECGSYYELKERLDGGFSELQFNKLKFHFVEEYEIQPGKKLPFTIYDKQHNIVASSDENGVTTGGVSALNYEFDNNQYNIDVSGLGLSLNEFYLLEVKCLDGRKYYMNFVIRN